MLSHAESPEFSTVLGLIINPHAQRERGKVIGCGVHIYIFTPHAQRERGKVIGCGVHIYVCERKKYLNRKLEIDSPFQTFAVGLLVEFID